jgi:excisionase family DNA binding protein
VSRPAPHAKTEAPESTIEKQRPCPAGFCESHWSRRRRLVPEFRANLCRSCFSGRPLRAKADGGEGDGSQHGAGQRDSREVGVVWRANRDFVSVSVAARIAKCSPDTVLRWIEEGAITAGRITPGGWYRVDFDSLARFMATPDFWLLARHRALQNHPKKGVLAALAY